MDLEIAYALIPGASIALGLDDGGHPSTDDRPEPDPIDRSIEGG